MIVRTVLGDIDPTELGVTYAHEHLIIDSSTVAREWPHIHLPSVDEAVAEVGICVAAGVNAFIDAMPTGSGRNLDKLAQVSRSTGAHVIATTGMHTMKYYEGVEWANDDAGSLAHRFLAEIQQGVNGVRAGVIKVATTGPSLTERERAVIEAAGIVHERTGVPVLTHCEEGLGALEQIGALEGAGVDLSRVIVSHTDKVAEVDYHKAILETGVNVEYDQSLRQHLVGSSGTASLVAAMLERGFGDQLLLGTDGARRSLWTSLGGSPGLAWLKRGFPVVLAEYGVTDQNLHSMLVRNPARILAFHPD
ncbi:MAG: hypothetical protein DWQ40_04025 [Actinobacteria bacterium]|nr:MAG: hypothetical protein DWQ40_04025 [Actinomycetota bacterium]REK38264.1 MAG: hypothetical protein DWQ20_03955 [Actinomycetota bacterium]